MKKLFSIAAVALIALSFASCDKKEPGSDKFTIEVSDIKATSAFVKVTPKDLKATYYFTIVEAADIAKLSDADVIKDFIIGEMDLIIEYYKEYDPSYIDLLSRGADEYDFAGLSPKTDYAVIAAYVDENGKATDGKLAKKLFTTTEKGTTNLTFKLTNTGSSLVITPSNDVDPWDYYIASDEEMEMFSNNPDELAAAAFDMYGDEYAAPGAEELLFSELLEYYDPGKYTLVVWGCDGAVTTKAATLAFTLPASATAPARVRAIKMIERNTRAHKQVHLAK